MTSPPRRPAVKAAIAFLEKIWEPMAEVMAPAELKEPVPVRVAVEFGVRVARRRTSAPRITIRDWC